MKKLLVITVIGAMAISASATTLKWGLNSGESLTSLGFSEGTIYLVQGSLPSTTGWDSKTSFSFSDLGGTEIASGSLSSGAFVDDTGIVVESVGGSTGRKPFYVAIFSDDGKSMALADSAKSVNIQAGITSATVKYDADRFTKYSAQAVPEPTTVALLALGLAAVGLKRKLA